MKRQKKHRKGRRMIFYQFLQSDEVMDIFEEYLYLPYQEE